MTDQTTERPHHLHRRKAMKAAGGLGVGGLLSGCSSNTALLGSTDTSQPRNIVFVLSDDHRYDFMDFVDEPGTPEFLETPNMDRMANRGAHLPNTTVSTSLCAPSRASILTGQYAHEHGVIDNQHPRSDHDPFFVDHLKDAGYETAFIGKWDTFRINSAEPRPAFDRWVSFEKQGNYIDPQLNVDGDWVQHNGYITDILTKYALRWLRNRSGDKPFFLYLSHKAPHAWFRPAPRHRGRYADAPIEYPETMANSPANYRDKPDWVREQRDSVRGVDYVFGGNFGFGGPSGFDTLYRKYCETLLSLDESIGAVMDQLDTSGVADSTLTLYMSDNGFSLGEHGLIGKQTAYEPSMRVPLLAWAPGLVESGTTIDRAVSNVDLAPTFLEVADISRPGYMSGESFLPALAGEGTARSQDPYYESFWGGFPKHPTMFSTRRGRYKYIWYYGPMQDELYDLQADPAEANNLFDDGKHEQRRKAMHDRLFDWIESGGGVPIPLQRERRGDNRKKRPKNAPKTAPDDLAGESGRNNRNGKNGKSGKSG
ncbi:sulfatase [Halococcus sp. IIIV-5B]|uniref:sulfatase family protein n=1 Tax=Halococcus sp. IIIV-5B TaxID=2321230 RepID=UPI000E727144|nr:sulfatase [Halococcus sp. IIIV-5B]RJT05441.1 DUF4976 domain-containing protein [Halococcus sp. IIIV-5B]